MQFFGKRGTAFFDAWTIVHLCFWLVVGANFKQIGAPPFLFWPLVGVGAYAWEIVESWLDEYTNLEMTKEGRINRWVSDPIMAYVGSLLGWMLIGS